MKLTGKKLAEFVVTKIGTPYVYGAKGADGKLTMDRLNYLRKNYPSVITSSYYLKAKRYVGKVCCDCSGLISWYTKKVYGSSQLYSIATTKKTINKHNISEIPVGAVVWKPGHVGVYIGNGYVVEAMGIDYGTVKTKLVNRTFTHWLLFSFMEYDTKVSNKKNKNKCPYTKPKKEVSVGDTGESVKWVQWHLVKAGYDIAIDGMYGNNTFAAVKKYKRSCKVTPINGKVTLSIIKLLAEEV